VIVFLFVLFAGVAGAEEYYVSSSDGDDGNDGKSPGSAWRTLGHVNGYGDFQEGDDIYFKCGDRWTASSTSGYMRVRWNGNAGDRATIGAYYGSEKECGSRDKPVIDGNFVAPYNTWVGLVNVGGRSYVTVENLRLINSDGQGVRFLGGGRYDRSNNGIVRNVDVDYTRNAGIQWSYSDDGLAEGCTVTRAGMGYRLGVLNDVDYDEDATYDKYDYVKYPVRRGNFRCERDGTSGVAPNDPVHGAFGSGAHYWAYEGDWPFGMGASQWCDNITVRGCTVYNTFTEGIGFYKGADDCVAENNVVYNTFSGGIYIDGGQNNIIRNNLVYETTDSEFYKGGKVSGGIGVADEGLITVTIDGEKLPLSRSKNNLFYGNLVAFSSKGMSIGASLNGAFEVSEGEYVKGRSVFENSHYIGNTFVGNNGGVWIFGRQFSGSSVRNNIFYSVDDSSLFYSEPEMTDTPGLEWSNNLWYSESGNGDYIHGVGDVAENPMLMKTTGWRDLTAGSLSASDFMLRDGSPAIGAGVEIDDEEYALDYFGSLRDD